MKNIITILVGIVIGCTSTLIIQRFQALPAKHIIEQKTDGWGFFGGRLTEFTIDNIVVGTYAGSRMTLTMKDDTRTSIEIWLSPLDGEKPKKMHSIIIYDEEGISEFIDKNHDGTWDVKERKPWQTHVIDSDSLRDYVLPNGEMTGSFDKWKSEWKNEANQSSEPILKTPVE